MTPAWLPSKAGGPEVNYLKNGSFFNKEGKEGSFLSTFQSEVEITCPSVSTGKWAWGEERMSMHMCMRVLQGGDGEEQHSGPI